MPPVRYAAFLSYSSADLAIAQRVQRALEGYRIPKSIRGQTTRFGLIGERLGKVCRDRTDFKSGESLTATLLEALEGSSSVILLCSPASANSKWVNAEIAHFQKLGRAARIFPIIVAPSESGRVADCFPPALRREGEDEPIAADLQPQGDGFADGVLKVIAGVLDVDFDALRQRELQAARARTRIAYGAAGGFALLAGAAVAAGLVALQQRDLALRSFGEAMTITADSADRAIMLTDRTELPRAVISGFLAETEGDLQRLMSIEEMRAHPRLRFMAAKAQLLFSDLYGEIGRSAEQLKASQAAQALHQRIAADIADPLRRVAAAARFAQEQGGLEFETDILSALIDESMGKALANNGALGAALTRFNDCRAKRLGLIADWELSPEETAALSNDALKCAALQANALAGQGSPGAALAVLEPMVDKSDSAAPTLGFARIVLAEIFADTGRLTRAIALLNGELQEQSAAPTGRDARLAFTKLLETRAKIVALTGAIHEALADLDRAEALLGGFVGGDGADRQVLLVKSQILTTMGETRALAGERDVAEERFLAAGALLDRLLEFDENRRDWRLARAALLNARAENALRLFEADTTRAGALAAAQRGARASLADIKKAAGPNDEVAARARLAAEVSLARALRLGGDIVSARSLLRAAATRLAAQEGDGAPDPAAHGLRVALVTDELADLSVNADDYASAFSLYDEAIARYRAYVAREPDFALAARDLLWVQMASARALRAGGKVREAKVRLAEACRSKASAALAEYSLYVRDAAALDGLAAQLGVRCS